MDGTYGTLDLAAEGSYTYTLNTAGVQHLAQGESLTDSFGYQASDEHGALSNFATLAIHINGVNDAPVATDDTASMTEDTATVTGNVLTNDTDVDHGAVVTVDADSVGSFDGTYGTPDLAADGSYTYTLNTAGAQHLAQGESLTDSFSYKATAEHGALSNSAPLATHINADTTPLRATDDTATMTEDTATVTGNVLTNDTDVDHGATISVDAGSVG